MTAATTASVETGAESRRHRWRRELPWLSAAEAGTFAATVGVLQLWRARPRVPFYSCYTPVGRIGSGCDAVFYAGITKTILTHGWYYDNSKLGFPTGSNLRDFPNVDVWHALFMRSFSVVSQNWALAMNVLYVGSFLVIAAAAYIALRCLSVRAPIAAGGAIVMAFLPYHMVRNEEHLLWSDYSVAPLVVMLSVVQLSNRPWLRVKRDGPSSRHRWVGAVAIAVFAGGTLAYYSVMSVAVLLLPALLASVIRRRLEPAISALVLVGVIGVVFGAQLIPTVINDAQHGRNHTFDRPLADQDAFSLRPLLLIAPRDNHRISMLSSVTRTYENVPRPSEGGQALGLVAAAGLVGLLGTAAAPLLGRRGLRHPYDRGLALVGVTALLMGVTAGGGEILAIAGLRQVRAWDRISVFLAFVGIAAAARFLDRLLARRGVTTKSVVAIVAVCTVVAILDQTSPVDVPPYKATAAQFATEQAFVKGIERTVGPHAAILQLPYVAYPEFGFQWRMRDYSHLRGWLYSDTLRWSYGAIKGRPNWQDGQVGLPFPEQLRRARRAGFTAVWIDRRGYRDKGKAIERRVRACLGAPISVERDKHRVLYDLRAAPHC